MSFCKECTHYSSCIECEENRDINNNCLCMPGYTEDNDKKCIEKISKEEFSIIVGVTIYMSLILFLLLLYYFRRKYNQYKER